MLNALLQKLTGKSKPKTKTQQTIAHENQYVAPNYHPLPVVLQRGEGLYLWDQEGKKYLDMMSAYSAVSCGHAHPRMAARLWGYSVKGIPENAAEIIVAEGNFHGRTTTVISFSTEADYRKNFGPFTPGFLAVPFGDLKAIEASITPNTAAILIEPIQGEAGIKTPPEGFLRDLRALCDKHNVLLILDEVQSGLGRTGKMFCYQHENILPDLLVLGKALGGGLLPVSAVVGKRAVINLFKPGSHGSTFGGNPLAAAVGLESLQVLEEEGMVENSARLGEYMLNQLRGINSPLIRDVRGKGLWIGVDFDPARVPARKICEMLMTRGILSKDTHETVVRFAPPLTITQSEIDWCLDQFREVLREVA